MATPDRWPPYIEPDVAASAATNITLATPVFIPGCSVTVTPHINSRAYVYFQADCELTAAPGGTLAIKATLNGTGTGYSTIFKVLTLNERQTVSGEAVYDLLANTTYVIGLTAQLTAVGSTYNVRNFNTRLGPIIMMPNLHA